MKRAVGIAGLGLIGGSLAKAIKARTDCTVLGFDTCAAVMAQAREERVLDGELNDTIIAECDIVIIALYPDDVIRYCKRCLPLMRKGSIAVDCGGVKTRICTELSALAGEYSVRFVGGHPMAGVERSGYEHSFADLFNSATMILCKDSHTDPVALDELGPFFTSLGFGSIKITSAAEHDEIVAYTSQLAHMVSSAYIRSDTMQKRYGFSAGSFKDLTRVAKLNEDMWTALFFENRDNLLRETDAFMEELRRYRDALASNDHSAMKELLGTSTALKIADEMEEEKWLKKQK